MNITLIQVGKTDDAYLREGVGVYLKRINHYTKFDIVTVPDLKNIDKTVGDSYLVLLDEAGRQPDSVAFAAWLQKRMNSGVKRLCFVIGGPYGFSQELYARANDTVSLSPMTFSHQLVRLVFAEQLYRAFTILNNEPYHHN